MLKLRTAVLNNTLERDHCLAIRSRPFPYLRDANCTGPAYETVSLRFPAPGGSIEATLSP
jgi:hypothetical protein